MVQSVESARIRRAASGLGVVLVAIHLLLAFLPLEGTRGIYSSLIFAFAAMLALTSAVVARTFLSGKERRIWTYLAVSSLGLTLAGIGRLWWAVTEYRSPPIGSFEDVGYVIALFAIIPFVAAIGNPAHSSVKRRVSNGLDMMVLILITLSVIWIFVLKPLGAVGSGVEETRQILFTLYLVLAIGLALYPVFFRDDVWTPWARLVVLGVGAAAVTIIATLAGDSSNLAEFGSRLNAVVETPLVLSFVVFGMASVWRTYVPEGLTYGLAPRGELPRWPGMMVGLLSLFGIPLAIYYAVSSSDSLERVVLGISASLLAILLVARSTISLYENKGLEEAREAIRRYRSLLENAPVGTVVVSAQGAIVYANPSAVRMLDAATTAELIGIGLIDLVPPEERTKSAYLEMQELIRSFSNDRSVTTIVAPAAMLIRGLKGRLVEIDRTASVITYEGETSLLIQAQDVTARVQAERSLEEYRDRLRRLTAESFVTEERERRALAELLDDQVVQSLAAAKARLQAAQAEGFCSGSDFDSGLEMLDRAISHTQHLVSHITPHVLYESGLEEALAWLAEQMGRLHSLECTIVGSIDTGDISEDGLAVLYRSTSELLMNVVEHAHTDHATIELTSDADSLAVAVVDTGAGFVPGEPASPGHHTFGLFSVRERAKQLGGDMVVDSVPGQGTRVTIRIPCS